MIEYENLHRSNKKFIIEFQEAFSKTLKRGNFILGDELRNFENLFAKYCGRKYCVGVASGLDALFLSLRTCSFQEGDEIIVPSNTYIASIFAIINAGLKPVLVEPDIRTYTINPFKIEEKISSRTKAIMPVHLYGKISDMEMISSIAEKNNLLIIEDCAQAHGAMLNGKRAGTFGQFGAFSFYPTKNLGALGDGGAVITNNSESYSRLRSFRNYGSELKNYNEIVGYNSRLDEIQAAFLSVKLHSLDKINEHKRTLAGIYNQNLNEDYIKPVTDERFYDVYHIYAIRHERRDKLKKFLLDNEIETAIHYPVAPHFQNALKKYFVSQEFPISEKIHSTILSLPISSFHTEIDILKVIEVMNKF